MGSKRVCGDEIGLWGWRQVPQNPAAGEELNLRVDSAIAPPRAGIRWQYGSRNLTKPHADGCESALVSNPHYVRTLRTTDMASWASCVISSNLPCEIRFDLTSQLPPQQCTLGWAR